MKILMAGDVVGSAGRTVLSHVIARMREAGQADFVVANGENAAGGRGITGAIAEEMFGFGVDVITMGDHTWNQRELASYIGRQERLLRPANFAPGCPGVGIVTVPTDSSPVTVVNLAGRVFMGEKHDCPFRCADQLLMGLGRDRVILVDMHAEATSEKIVMGRYLEGRVSAVVGTHTHVQTSDEILLPKGTAYITDMGMTGVKNSAIGRELDSVVEMFLNGMPSRFKLAKGPAVMEGVWLEVDDRTGRALKIRRLRETVTGAAATAFG
jgi:metallophosphoesterase (TIGR00282 family)